MTFPFAAMQTPTAALFNRAIVDVDAEVNLAPAALQSITSTSFTSVTGMSSSYTKKDAATRLLVLPIFTCYVTWSGATFAKTEFAIQVDGTDTVAGYYNFNAQNDHRQVVGGCLIPGLTAGAKTIQLRGRVTDATLSRALVFDNNDRVTLLTFEIP